MGKLVKIELEVTPEAASRLRDEDSRRRAGELLSRIVCTERGEADPLMRLFEEIGRDAEAAGLTDEEIEAELAAYNTERRHRR